MSHNNCPNTPPPHPAQTTFQWNLPGSCIITDFSLSAAQSSAQTRIHNAILFIDTSNKASYNQVHWLVRTPYLSIKASNGWSNQSMFLPPATKLGQGYVFTGVCDSAHRGDVCLSACWDTTNPQEAVTLLEQTTPRSRQHPREQTPWELTPPGADTPLGVDTHPRSWHPLEQTPPQQTHAQSRHPWSRPPRSRHPLQQTPPPPPGAEHAARYSQLAGGMHPTWMQSCITKSQHINCV